MIVRILEYCRLNERDENANAVKPLFNLFSPLVLCDILAYLDQVLCLKLGDRLEPEFQNQHLRHDRACMVGSISCSKSMGIISNVPLDRQKDFREQRFDSDIKFSGLK